MHERKRYPIFIKQYISNSISTSIRNRYKVHALKSDPKNEDIIPKRIRNGAQKLLNNYQTTMRKKRVSTAVYAELTLGVLQIKDSSGGKLRREPT